MGRQPTDDGGYGTDGPNPISRPRRADAGSLLKPPRRERHGVYVVVVVGGSPQWVMHCSIYLTYHALGTSAGAALGAAAIPTL